MAPVCTAANIATGALLTARFGHPHVESRLPVPEYAALDLETTGLDPARDRVIEVGAVAFTPDRITTTLERLVDPGRSVPEIVLRLTGIKAEELRGAASAESALRELADFLHGRQHVAPGAKRQHSFAASGDGLHAAKPPPGPGRCRRHAPAPAAPA